MFGEAGEPIYLAGSMLAGPKSRERQPPPIMVWKQWAAAACGAMMAGLAAGWLLGRSWQKIRTCKMAIRDGEVKK